jgi:hypothetical protein
MADQTVECEVTAARLACGACGTTGLVTREAGAIASRLARFAACHLQPHVVSLRLRIDGTDAGWRDAALPTGIDPTD